jgi:hypothetical protein
MMTVMSAPITRRRSALRVYEGTLRQKYKREIVLEDGGTCIFFDRFAVEQMPFWALCANQKLDVHNILGHRH